jgi:hypothetical protein
VTATPLSVVAELNEPQVLAELPGVQVQFTPAASLAVAVMA